MPAKYFFPFLLLVVIYSCKSSFYEVNKHNSNATIIKRGKIESVIFSKEADCFLCNFPGSGFTPTVEEINEAEKILKKDIKSASKPMYNQGDGYPIIHNNLNKYRRQYYGYINKDGEKILYVNFLWAKYTFIERLKGYHKDEGENWKSEREIVLDGGCNYWQIEINLTQKKLSNLHVNGVG